ncbi:hypothetical protein DUW70_17475 [Stenotrophomonas maltophilia]|nr:hypothetical protein DUW70_17475 [Stenotrophomonas maltophilia]
MRNEPHLTRLDNRNAKRPPSLAAVRFAFKGASTGWRSIGWIADVLQTVLQALEPDQHLVELLLAQIFEGRNAEAEQIPF